MKNEEKPKQRGGQNKFVVVLLCEQSMRKHLSKYVIQSQRNNVTGFFTFELFHVILEIKGFRMLKSPNLYNQ